MSAIFASRLSWVPSRLAWALTDRPTRSKGMWYGFAGAFLAGIAVASFATSAPKVDKAEQQTAAFRPEKADVPAKPAPVAAKPAKQEIAAAQKQAEKLAAEAPKVLAEVPKPAEPPKPVAEAPKPVVETPKPVAQAPKPAEAQKVDPPKVVAEVPVRVIAPDRVTPAPGAAPLDDTLPRAAPVTTYAPASAAPTTTAGSDASRRGNEPTTLVANDHAMPAPQDVPMPRSKPATLLAAAPQPPSPAPVPARELAVPPVSTSAEPTATEVGSTAPAITGRVPEPRSKPAHQVAALDRVPEPAQLPATANRQAPVLAEGTGREVAREEVIASRPAPRRSVRPSALRSDDPAQEAETVDDHFATVARLQTGAARPERLDARSEGSDRAERVTRGERHGRPEIMDERDRRRIDRAEERAISSRVSESRRRNEAEGFELVRSYRLPDGRRVSVYRRGEPRVAMRPPGLFGRPAFLLPPPGAMWR